MRLPLLATLTFCVLTGPMDAGARCGCVCEAWPGAPL